MGYYISINYDTGDSFHTETQTRSFGSGWTLEVAKENLKRLKEHHKAHGIVNNYYSMANHEAVEKLSEEWKKKPWYVGEKFSNGVEKLNDHSFMILNNDGSSKKEYAFWTGYFEHLNSATIQVEEPEIDDNDMCYTP